MMQAAKKSNVPSRQDDMVMYIICNVAPPVAVPMTGRSPCAAGCGRTVIHSLKRPCEAPLVCLPCAEWLGDCQGEA